MTLRNVRCKIDTNERQSDMCPAKHFSGRHDPIIKGLENIKQLDQENRKMSRKHASEWPFFQDSEDCEVHTVIAQLAAKHHTRQNISQEGDIITQRDSRIVCDTIMRTGKCKRNTRPRGGLARTLSNVRRIALSRNSACRAAYLKKSISERQGILEYCEATSR